MFEVCLKSYYMYLYRMYFLYHFLFYLFIFRNVYFHCWYSKYIFCFAFWMWGFLCDGVLFYFFFTLYLYKYFNILRTFSYMLVWLFRGKVHFFEMATIKP